MQFRYPLDLIPSEHQVIARVIDVPEAIDDVRTGGGTDRIPVGAVSDGGSSMKFP